ncbi:transcription factor Adf-1-like [Periplaneta americana]|uniref:transcription factor Adf-1-like n=1 Tax=Periplaneta americana TaxID=6978 RepID=UPI0037E7064E
MSEAKVLFTVLEDEKLVEVVSKFPCIFDVASPVYKDQTVKDIAWKEIAEFVERSEHDCKKRWRNIKDTYQKRKKKGKGTGASVSSKGKKWLLEDMLTFLDKEIHKRESISNTQCDDTSSQENDILTIEDTATEDAPALSTSQITSDTSTQNVGRTMNSLRPPSKRQRLHEKTIGLLEDRRIERNNIIDSLNQNYDDDVDLFFKSIAMSVKKLPPNLIHEAKMTSLQMVFDLESRYTNSFILTPESSASTSTSSYMT